MRSARIVAATLVLLSFGSRSDVVGQEGPGPEEMRPGVGSHTLTLAPVFGFRGSLISDRTLMAVAVGDLVASRFEWGGARGAGPAVGVEADLRLLGSVGVMGLGMYLGADDVTMLKSVDSRIVSETVFAGAEAWIAAAAISVRLPEEVPNGPAGFLFAGPAWIRQDYDGTIFSVPGLEDRVESPAVWIGYRALVPIRMRNAALSLVLEDLIPIWDREGDRERLMQALELSDADVSAGLRGASHVPMLRVGLALRL